MKSVYGWIDPKDMFIGTYEFAETTKYADNCMQVALIVFWNALRRFTEEIGCFPEWRWCMNPVTSKNRPRSHLDFSQL
jgi:hypothetical protein